MQTVHQDITDEIKTLCRDFESAFAKGDAAGIAALYTQDGMLLPSGSDIVQGQEAISQYWQGAINAGMKECHLETVEVELLEDTAIELGRYVLLGDGGRTLDQGKNMVVWKKISGDWRIQKDIWNSNSGN
ncbi:YybH family protein [Rufibacter hautae]|uniref:SgcJ/EcaC family oxidoreductase n=1 Tax=Rufibacter hautae TaxID=2595005 RepID=A0A5B6TCV7_9BACT|nr:SgcJ/EcaC family oxidoreductase [Rufibacter hautae]KAA3436854.1 SgcJ/EcaC family oxidoreductase [Rufibacter hautae]